MAIPQPQVMQSTHSPTKPHLRAVDDAPFVVFALTLVLLAVTCAVLSYYVMFVPLPNPQVQDWNSFLDRFNRLEICLENHIDSSYQKSSLDEKIRDFAFFRHAVKNGSDNIAISLFLQFGIRNVDWFCNQNASIYFLHFEVDPKQIGLYAESNGGTLQVGFILTSFQFTKACMANSTKNFTVGTCVHLKGSSLFLPSKKHPEQCVVNDQDPADLFADINSSAILRPNIAPHVVKGGVLEDLSSGTERRICSKGGILASPTFSSDGNKSSAFLPRETCRLISYRLLMAAVILLFAVPVFVGCGHICRKFDNSRLMSGGDVVSIPYTPVKAK